MSIQLLQQFLVYSIIFFSSFANAYSTITSTSNRVCYKEKNEFRICYSKSVLTKNRQTIATLTINDIKHIGGVVYVKYIGSDRNKVKKTRIKFRPGNGKLFLHGKDIRGGGEVIETDTEKEYELEFKPKDGGYGMKTMFLSYQPKNTLRGDVYISVGQGSEKKIEFEETTPNDYCRLSVTDAKGKFSFRNYGDDINTASFIYDTDQEKHIEFKYEEIKYQGENGSIAALASIENSFTSLLYGDSNYNFGATLPKLIGRLSKYKKDHTFKVNGLGAVFISPFIDSDKSSLPAGRYTIRVTVTCN